MTIPWKILHIELSENIPTLPNDGDCQKIYIVFWWHGVPLGHQEIDAAQLPIPATQLLNLAVQAITPAIGDRLLSEGFNVPLSEHSECQPEIKPANFQSLLALDKPLTKLNKYESNLDESVNEMVSVVICTRNRPEQLARCLRSLKTLSPQPLEIIVVDNAPSNDETRKIVEQIPGIHYVLEPRPGLSIARNTGIRHCTGDIIAFTDDDVVVHPDWLKRLQLCFKNPEVMAITGLILPAELETESQLIFEIGLGNFGWGYHTKVFDSKFFQATKYLGVPVWRIGAGANMAFRSCCFERVGNFDERLGAGASGCSEDSELWYRILAEGGVCLYEPTAVVFHYHRREIDSLKRQMYQYMRGHVTALFVQFERYKHWGNLRRLFWSLPKYYAGLLVKGLLWGFGLQHKTYLTEILGCFGGILYYLKNRNHGNLSKY